MLVLNLVLVVRSKAPFYQVFLIQLKIRVIWFWNIVMCFSPLFFEQKVNFSGILAPSRSFLCADGAIYIWIDRVQKVNKIARGIYLYVGRAKRPFWFSSPRAISAIPFSTAELFCAWSRECCESNERLGASEVFEWSLLSGYTKNRQILLQPPIRRPCFWAKVVGSKRGEKRAFLLFPLTSPIRRLSVEKKKSARSPVNLLLLLEPYGVFQGEAFYCFARSIWPPWRSSTTWTVGSDC